MSTPRNSAIYTGILRHRRVRPREHAFAHGVYHVLLDLDELGELDAEVAGFGHNRAAPTSFHDVDHLGSADLPVREKLRRWLGAHGVALPGGRVELLTNLRVLGHVFNPVSWFYCYDDRGRLALVVAEVNNTFGESYGYILDDLEWRGSVVRSRRPKRFHVSPFMDVEGHRYDFALRRPGARVTVHMDVHDEAGKLFDATLGERRRPLTTRTLWTTLLRYPLMTLRTVALIHWQALRLWLKRVPLSRKPEPPDNRYDATRTVQTASSRATVVPSPSTAPDRELAP